jgi:Caspase domain
MSARTLRIAVAFQFLNVWVATCAAQHAQDLSQPTGRDPYAKRSIGVILRGMDIRGPDPPVSSLHVILLIDSDASNIRAGTVKDEDSMQRLFREGFVNCLPVHVHPMSGADLTPPRVLAAIAALNLTEDDALVVYYSGHGLMVTTNEVVGEVANTNGPQQIYRSYHVLDFAHGQLARANLRVAMEDTPARLKILITDCCAPTGRTATAPLNPNFKAPKDLSAKEVNKEVVQGLFLRHSGFVDVSTGDALAELTKGGVMTQTFLAACCYHGTTFMAQPRTRVPVQARGMRQSPTRIDRNQDGFIDWQEFYQFWLHYVVEYSGAAQDAALRLN